MVVQFVASDKVYPAISNPGFIVVRPMTSQTSFRDAVETAITALFETKTSVQNSTWDMGR